MDKQIIERYDNGFYLLLNGIDVPQRPLSQVEKMRQEVVRILSFCGLSVRCGHVQYMERSIAVAFTCTSDLFGDIATVAVRRARRMLADSIGRRVSIAVDGRDGTVWMEADEV